jgi:hypothetical protein
LRLGSVVVSLSPQRPGFDPKSVRGIFVVDKGHWVRLLSQYFCFRLSVSFHHCSIIIPVIILLLPAGQASEAWEPSKQRCFGFRGAVERKYADNCAGGTTLAAPRSAPPAVCLRVGPQPVSWPHAETRTQESIKGCKARPVARCR